MLPPWLYLFHRGIQIPRNLFFVSLKNSTTSPTPPPPHPKPKNPQNLNNKCVPLCLSFTQVKHGRLFKWIWEIKFWHWIREDKLRKCWHFCKRVRYFTAIKILWIKALHPSTLVIKIHLNFRSVQCWKSHLIPHQQGKYWCLWKTGAAFLKGHSSVLVFEITTVFLV